MSWHVYFPHHCLLFITLFVIITIRLLTDLLGKIQVLFVNFNYIIAMWKLCLCKALLLFLGLKSNSADFALMTMHFDIIRWVLKRLLRAPPESQLFKWSDNIRIGGAKFSNISSERQMSTNMNIVVGICTVYIIYYTLNITHTHLYLTFRIKSFFDKNRKLKWDRASQAPRAQIDIVCLVRSCNN